MSTIESAFTVALIKAWQQELDFNQLIGQAEQLDAQGLNILATVLYQSWLQRNQSPFKHIAYFNLGTLLFNQGDLQGAKTAYDNAIELAPNFMQPRFNLGLIYERMGQADAAIAAWRWIDDQVAANDLENRPLLIMALNNLGRIQETLKRYPAATDYLARSLNLEPNQPDACTTGYFYGKNNVPGRYIYRSMEFQKP